jgi:membrane fusion protein (multidrug efflux system)
MLSFRLAHQAAWACTALALAACGKSPLSTDAANTSAASAPAGAAIASADAASAPVLLLAPEDLHTVRAGGAGNGPVVTGSIQPEKRADLRAEVAAVVTQVLKDNGETVRRGDLLMRLDDVAIRESLQSAEAGLRAAQQAFDQAQRQVERLKTLQAQGMTSVQALDDAEGRRNAAQSELVAARSRVVSAQQQLRRTEVRAPFDGVVSERKASVGDTAQIGKELVKVIDPDSLRFEGFVSADSIGEVKVGQPVWFRIHGFEGRDFTGEVMRVNPAANSTTRQVEVLVAFDDQKQQDVAGLYAEGRIETRTTAALALPDASVVREGDKAFAWKVNGDKLEKVALALGERDARTGAYTLKSGLAEGDRVLRFPSATLQEGQPVHSDPESTTTVVAEK